MSVWLVIALALTAVAVLLVLLPVRVHLSLQGRGEPSGFWALAGGAQIGPLSASGVVAQGVPASVGVHLGRRKLWGKELREIARKKKETEPDPAELGTRERAQRAIARAQRRYTQLERWVDPAELARFLVRERRRIEVERIEIDLDYDFADIALTGKVLGAIYAFSPLLPAAVVIRQHPGWDFEDRAAVAAAGKIRVWPGLLVADAVWFVIRKGRVFRRADAARGAVKVS